ncbi:histidine phosphatase family protein [Neobacillus vireti]|uniref:Phosphoglycerate mutase family protein n=1 Tax=Neobacillus vireti LMG 21834 TaxID=1131730 RepID=A0AB94IV36_9BACI|nr:histidine phosphatase family protein [Neobacillus vireti]ETI70896.1 phosphoglycerate mutase family protein [Neobacillus vireti LMG 21834]KLT17573.1 phosphoglycerate mutase [Neobacillus vireti]
MTNLYFVRHAHSTYTPDEIGRPLSALGLADAEIITQMLINENINRVISSPYKRAIQTVQGVAEFFGKEIEIVHDFKERTLSDKPLEDFNSAIAKVWADESYSWEGGESNILAQARGVKATMNVLEKYADENIVIGTHGNLMVLIMKHFDKQFGFRFWQELAMPDIYKLTFDKIKLVEVNRVWH